MKNYLNYAGTVVLQELTQKIIEIATMLLFLSLSTQAFGQSVSSDVRTLAGPVDFHIEVTSDDSIRLSWNEQLLSGDEVETWYLYNGEERFRVLSADAFGSSYSLLNVQRDRNYDFSIVGVTIDGEETRKSNRIYLDMPPADRAWDGGNRYLPPLTGVSARTLDGQSAELTWDQPPSHWRPSETAPYSYSIWVNQSLVGITNELSWTYTDFPANTITWVGIKAETIDDYIGRQMVMIAVDTRFPSGSVFEGYPGFFPPSSLRADVYSHNSAEIFWKHTSFPNIDHIFLNGRMIDRIEGSSYFFPSLPSGETIQLAVGSGWTYNDNGHDSLLTLLNITLPPETGRSPGGNIPDNASSISVENGLILLSGSDWYQVQDANTYESVCEGVTSCPVSAGTYIVINHTTGERTEDVHVSETEQTGGIQIQGNQLSWPDDGWYQVQNANNYVSVCEGGTSCIVGPGTYIVINHSTGERSEMTILP